MRSQFHKSLIIFHESFYAFYILMYRPVKFWFIYLFIYLFNVYSFIESIGVTLVTKII